MSVFHNNALIGSAGGAAADTAADIPKSLRFNSGDSAYLSRTPSSNGNRRTFTFSCWVKRSKPVPSSSGQELFRAGDSALSAMNFAPSDGPVDSLSFKADQGGVSPGSATNAVFRDFSAWMHVVYRIDTTQATAADRVRIYVNGVEQTFHTANYPSQNQELKINQSGQPHYIGGKEYFDGYLADIYLIDGSSLDPTSFAAYDDNGVWQAIGYSGTFGTNGFHLLDFANESTIGHDSSGNENDFTANNFVAAAGVAAAGARSAAVFFDGTDDKISFTNNSDLNPGNGTFTLECFVYKQPGQQVVVYYGTGVGQAGFRVLGNSKLGVERINQAFDLQTSSTVPENQWVHVAWVKSGTTIKGYINGQEAGSAITSQTYQGTFVTGKTLGDHNNMVISDLHLVKGTALYTTSSFTPPTTISAHANTKLLCFQNASSATTATTKPSGVTLTASSSPVAGAYPATEAKDVDVLFDVPTNGDQSDTGAGGEVSGNYPTWNPLDNGGVTLANGNLDASHSASNHKACRATVKFPESGKWYYEAEITTLGNAVCIGLDTSGAANPNLATSGANFILVNSGGSVQRYLGSGFTSFDSAYDDPAVGSILQVAYDADADDLWLGMNNVWMGSGSSANGNPGAGSEASASNINSGFPVLDLEGTSALAVNFGQRSFSYAAPTNFKPLCTALLPTPTIAKGSDYFNTVLFTGNDSTRSITGVGHNPDLVWIKTRSQANDHVWVDSVRGVGVRLFSNDTIAESTQAASVTSFDSDGFSLGSHSSVNQNNVTHVAWCWDAGSSTASNTDGNITSSVRANQTAGFSIVTYTGTSSTTNTVGHGLGAAPELIILKQRNGSSVWPVYHASLGTQVGGITLDGTSAAVLNRPAVFPTAPTSTVYTIGNDANQNGSGNTYVAYCFASVAGYSAFGSYTGDAGSSNFVHLGFKPRLLIIKRSSDGSNGWHMADTARSPENVANEYLYADTNGAEETNGSIDILSNGFCLKANAQTTNNSGVTYVYMAWAENPFQANGGLAR